MSSVYKRGKKAWFSLSFYLRYLESDLPFKTFIERPEDRINQIKSGLDRFL